MNDLLTINVRKPSQTGFALFEKGFRPFFLLAALHGLVLVPLWLVVHSGTLPVSDYFHPNVWHSHEMVFGYSGAVVAGFLLTAVTNWTKRTTAIGGWLGLLCVLWIAGRVAPFLHPLLPPLAVAAVSLSFLPALGFVLARAIVGVRNRRNYAILGIVAAMVAAQVVTHVGVISDNFPLEMIGPRVGVDLIILLIVIIAGRIIPAFTRNATGAEGIRSLALWDRAAIGLVAIVTVIDALMYSGTVLGVFGGLAAVATTVRMRFWGSRAALGNPLLWVLHIGYLFVPLGLTMRSLSAFFPEVGASASLHVLTAGAIGTLTLGMMVRVARGHTGRSLVAGRALTIAFACMILAAVVRTVGPHLGGTVSTVSVHIAGTLWGAAFLLYLLKLTPVLIRSRPDGRPG